MGRLKLGFELEVFDRRKAKSPRLADYLAVYVTNFGREHRTKTNELVDFLAAPPDERSIVCLGLSHNGVACGFALLIWFPQDGIGIVDHLVILPEHRDFGAFFVFSALIKKYLEQRNVQLEHLVAEIVVDERYVVSSMKPVNIIRMMRLIGFKVAKVRYWAPDPLIMVSKEGCKAAFMLISQISRDQLSIEEFTRIVRVIYEKHYLNWYRNTMDAAKFARYEKICIDTLREIEQLAGRERRIILNGMRDVDPTLALQPPPRADASTLSYILLILLPATIGAAVAFKQEVSIAAWATVITVALVVTCALVPWTRRHLLQLFRLGE